MSVVLYFGVLLLAAAEQLPVLLRSGRRREAAVWSALALLGAVLGVIWLGIAPDIGLAELLIVQ